MIHGACPLLAGNLIERNAGDLSILHDNQFVELPGKQELQGFMSKQRSQHALTRREGLRRAPARAKRARLPGGPRSR